MEFPKIKIRYRLLTKLLISHVFVAAIPIILAGWLLLTAMQDSIRETIVNQNIELARRAAQLISATLNQAQTVTRLTAQNPAIYEDNRLVQELMINNMVNQFPIFNQISILDTNGSTVVSTSFAETEESPLDEKQLNAVLTGQSYLSDFYIKSKQLPLINLAEPVRLHNEVVSILLAEVNLRTLWELMEQSVVGRLGEAFIFDKNGQYIAHSERKQIYLNNRFDEQDIIEDIEKGIQDQKIYFNTLGEEVLAAYTPLFGTDTSHAETNEFQKKAASLSNMIHDSSLVFEDYAETSNSDLQAANILKKLGWGLIIQQPTSEAFATAKKLRYLIFAVGFLSVFLATLLALINTKLIVLPVRKLMSGIERFSFGQLDYEIESLGHDEIGMLSERFNLMAKRLLEYQKKLKKTERFEVLSRMSSVLAHEIRNPLNSMVINLQIIRRELNKPMIKVEKMEKYCTILNTEIKRLDQLVQNFLLVSRPPKLKREKVFIDEILSNIILSQQVSALERGVRVERRFAQEEMAAFLDESKIKQVFLNIFLNAIQAMSGGGKLTVTLDMMQEYDLQQLQPGKAYARIQFVDTGKGIEANDLNHIFDFYYTTKDSGTGLGLSIAQQIVEEHDGLILVSSEVKKGSTFEIYLPLV